MEAIKAAGWTRFKPVEGQPIAEQDMKEVFKMVDMDKSGAISQLVRKLIHCLCNEFDITGTENGCEISWKTIWNQRREELFSNMVGLYILFICS